MSSRRTYRMRWELDCFPPIRATLSGARDLCAQAKRGAMLYDEDGNRIAMINAVGDCIVYTKDA